MNVLLNDEEGRNKIEIEDDAVYELKNSKVTGKDSISMELLKVEIERPYCAIHRVVLRIWSLFTRGVIDSNAATIKC